MLKKIIIYIYRQYPFVFRYLLYTKKYIYFKIKLLLWPFIIKLKKENNVFNKKPVVLQFPITFKCNFDCVMCGMQEIKNDVEMSIDELSKVLSDDFFSNIRVVGVNGGEPFMAHDIVGYCECLVTKLPKLKSIFIITNGYLTDRILMQLEKIKIICSRHKVSLHVSISIDGIGSIHDKMRGRDNIFPKVEETCLAIKKDQSKYCDSFDAICTITKLNVCNLNEVDAWAEQHNIVVSYNVATIHKRLHNEGRFEDFSVLTDERFKLLATEWFYSKFRLKFSQKYYALYRYLHDGKRISSCTFKYSGITLLPNGDMAFCATYSDVIGNGLNKSINDIVNENKDYKKTILKNHCDTCSHYSGSLTVAGYKEYVHDILDINKPSKFRIRGIK